MKAKKSKILLFLTACIVALFLSGPIAAGTNTIPWDADGDERIELI